MIRIKIVEDDAAVAADMKKYICRYAQVNGNEAAVEVYSNAVDFLRDYNKNTDIIFMDIELPGGINGMDAVRELRKTDSDVIVIFVTALAQYAVNGYEVSAFDFAVKPITYYDFAMKLRRAFARIAMQRGKELWVSTRAGKISVPVSGLRYVEIMKHVVTYHTVDGEIVASGTLKSVSAALEGLPFLLCNRCYLVNLQYVSGIDGNILRMGNDELIIASARRRDFLRGFNEYLGSGGDSKCQG